MKFKKSIYIYFFFLLFFLKRNSTILIVQEAKFTKNDFKKITAKYLLNQTILKISKIGKISCCMQNKFLEIFELLNYMIRCIFGVRYNIHRCFFNKKKRNVLHIN